MNPRRKLWLLMVVIAIVGAVLTVTACLSSRPEATWARTAGAGQTPVAGTTDWLRLADSTAAESATSLSAVENAGQNVLAWWLSPVAWYAGKTWGWQDSRTEGWLTRVYARQTPSGGYGIGESWDWGHDGTVNESSTAYSITTAWHVGRTLLDGYDDGGIPRERVLSAVTSLLDTQTTADGRCVSYSNALEDRAKPCVWNINATASWFLSRAYQRKIVPPGRDVEMLDKIGTWTSFTRENFRKDLGGWTYQQNTTTVQDAWHNAATVGPMYELDRAFGAEAMAGQFRLWPDHAADADLVIYDCAMATPALLGAARSSAFAAYTTQRERLQLRSRWPYTALRVHQVCFAAAKPKN